MPIPIEDFDREGDTLSDRVLQFLAQQADCACEVHEVAQALGEWPDTGEEKAGSRDICAMMLAFHDVLEELTLRKQVDKKIIGVKAYYVFMEQLPK